VKDAVTRGAIWRYFWMLVMDRKMSSLKFIEFVQNQMPVETVDQIITVGLMNLRSLISFYIPHDQVKEKKFVLFDTLVGLLSKEGVSKDPIVEQMFGFLSQESHITSALEWLDASKISQDGTCLYELKTNHKYSILKALFKASCAMTFEQKVELLEKTIGDDKSDIAQNTRDTCLACKACPDSKAKIWADITDMNSTESVYTRQAKMQGFYVNYQIELLRPYFDKFYDVIGEMHSKCTFKYMDNFFYAMLPRMEVDDSQIVRLVQMK